MKLFESLSRYQPQALGVLRIMTALQFIEHGSQKLFNFPVSADHHALSGLTMTAASSNSPAASCWRSACSRGP